MAPGGAHPRTPGAGSSARGGRTGGPSLRRGWFRLDSASCWRSPARCSREASSPRSQRRFLAPRNGIPLLRAIVVLHCRARGPLGPARVVGCVEDDEVGDRAREDQHHEQSCRAETVSREVQPLYAWQDEGEEEEQRHGGTIFDREDRPGGSEQLSCRRSVAGSPSQRVSGECPGAHWSGGCAKNGEAATHRDADTASS
jgi:hypothetical protein